MTHRLENNANFNIGGMLMWFGRPCRFQMKHEWRLNGLGQQTYYMRLMFNYNDHWLEVKVAEYEHVLTLPHNHTVLRCNTPNPQYLIRIRPEGIGSAP